MVCRAGDHTRSISQAKVSQAAGGIMSFAKVRPKCLGCKAQLEGSAVDLCKHCRPRVRLCLVHPQSRMVHGEQARCNHS